MSTGAPAARERTTLVPVLGIMTGILLPLSWFSPFTDGVIYMVAAFLCVYLSRRSSRTSAFFVHACGAGLLGGLGIRLYMEQEHVSMGVYLVSLSCFHVVEYWLVWLYNFDELSVDSFLLNHSTPYTVALTASLCASVQG